MPEPVRWAAPADNAAAPVMPGPPDANLTACATVGVALATRQPGGDVAASTTHIAAVTGSADVGHGVNSPTTSGPSAMKCPGLAAANVTGAFGAQDAGGGVARIGVEPRRHIDRQHPGTTGARERPLTAEPGTEGGVDHEIDTAMRPACRARHRRERRRPARAVARRRHVHRRRCCRARRARPHACPYPPPSISSAASGSSAPTRRRAPRPDRWRLRRSPASRRV